MTGPSTDFQELRGSTSHTQSSGHFQGSPGFCLEKDTTQEPLPVKDQPGLMWPVMGQGHARKMDPKWTWHAGLPQPHQEKANRDETLKYLRAWWAGFSFFTL